MTKFIITIAPDVENADAPTATARTTVRIDASAGRVLITELTVRAGQGQGLDPADLPAVDLGLLVRALTGPTATALPAPADVPQLADVSAGPAPARTRRPAAAGKRRGRAAATVTTAAGKRAYRRMPDAPKVLAAYAKAGSLSGVAAHFDVPRHTVAGWARRLRDQGYEIGGR